MNLTEEEVDLINKIAIKAEEAVNNKSIGRYQGWGLIWYKDARIYDWIKENYFSKISTLGHVGINVLRWSSLSRDEDDCLDFAVKLDDKLRLENFRKTYNLKVEPKDL